MRRAGGFTLLEALIALGITALALGLTFGLLTASKQLAWRADGVVERTLDIRAAVNEAHLARRDGVHPPAYRPVHSEVRSRAAVPRAQRQTRELDAGLETLGFSPMGQARVLETTRWADESALH